MSLGDEIIDSLRDFNDALRKGEVAERYTCRTFRLNLEPHQVTSTEVVAARELLRLSPTLFAQFLGVDVSVLEEWEQGVQEPSPMACRFVSEILMNPEVFQKRIADLAEPAG